MIISELGERLAKHPAYMAVAHLPTGLWLVSSLCDLLALVTGANLLVRLAHLAQTSGVLGTLILHLLRPAPEPDQALTPNERELTNLHHQLNAALPTLYALSAGLRSGADLERRRPATVPLVLSLLGAAGLFASRELARRRGVATGGELSLTGTRSHNGTFVPVATLADVPPGTMKRVEVGDDQVALVNVGGEMYAISNICPHRYGPLADGTLQDDMVTCPWHNSSFNVRTGAVAGGPARQPVATYAVRVDGDQILVRQP